MTSRATQVRTTWTQARESKEFVGPLTVTDTGQPTTTYEVAVVAAGERPRESSWTAPDLLGTQRGIYIGPGSSRPLRRGVYEIWIRVQAGVEVPVLDSVAKIVIT